MKLYRMDIELPAGNTKSKHLRARTFDSAVVAARKLFKLEKANGWTAWERKRIVLTCVQEIGELEN